MTLFEFLIALASVVIAMAITEIFAGWGRLLRAKNAPRIDWLHLGWCLVITLYAIQFWVSLWPYHDLEFTYIYQVWSLIFPALFIVLVAYAITPDEWQAESIDLRDYYMSQNKPVFLGLATFFAIGQTTDMLVLGIDFRLESFFVVIMAALPAFTKRVSIHATILIINLFIVVFNGFGFDPPSNGLIN
tara:strand:+ start:1339 stop:1902 length:564 start_codon:yes stop_codon:yes gene_type:complete